jgi:nucleotide-binding universal stress UspA family protein
MRIILVPTDFSPNADKALNYAVEVAKKAKAKIILMHACDLLELTFKDNLWLKREYNKNIINEANKKLMMYCESIKRSEKVTIQKKLYHGLVTDTIIHASIANKADLVIMGTLGNAGTKEKILGSKTAAVIRNAGVPVLAIPLLSEWKTPKKLLFAINSFSEGREERVRPLLDVAAMFTSAVTVIKFSDPAVYAPHKYKSTERAGNSYVKKINELLPGTPATFVHMEGHNFEKSIEKYIRQNKIDMVAMISHKRNFVSSLFHRSMTKRMAYHSSVPLLILPA